MKLPVLRVACAALALTLAPLGVRSATINYAPPAGNLPAGRYHGLTFSAVLPSGRLITPAGTSVVTGMNTLGVALSPDGRFAITSNGTEAEASARSAIDPDASGGYSLTVVETARMAVVAHYRAPGEQFFGSIATVKNPRDPAGAIVFASGGASNVVYVFELESDGRLVPDARHTIAIPGSADIGYADRGISFPSALLASNDGRHVYVVDASGETVAAIDVAERRLAGAPQRVGYSPSAVAIAGSQLLVSNEGLMRYGMLASPATEPPFAPVAADPPNASSLSLLALDASGAIAGPPQALPMDQAPDGVRLAGGAHPTAIVTTADGGYAFVAMTNVDRIATVALGGTPHVAGGTELRLFDRGPYGTQPTALALSHDGSRLYVALAGLDAVAVIDARDPVHLHRLGLIPTGWEPSALALSADDRTLFVANQYGLGHEAAPLPADALWSTLQRIDLASVKLADTTRATLGAVRNVTAMPPALPKVLHNAVVIVVGSANYDEIFGDLIGASGDPAFTLYGESTTPNLHALAKRFGIAANFFADAGESTQQVLTSGLASAFTTRTAGVRAARRPLGFANEDPEDELRTGSVFNELTRRNLSFRDYGGFLGVSGTTGATYTQNVPAASVLAGHVDLSYPAWNAPQSNAARAEEFVRDFGALSRAKRQPRFAYVTLPGAGTEAAVASADAALGAIVDFLSHLSSFRTTVVFVVPAGARTGRDHVDASRSYALVISPFVKRGYVGMRHLSGASVLKTVDRIFSLPPLSLGDLLANDAGDFFGKTADSRPYVAATAGVRGPGGQ